MLVNLVFGSFEICNLNHNHNKTLSCLLLDPFRSHFLTLSETSHNVFNLFYTDTWCSKNVVSSKKKRCQMQVEWTIKVFRILCGALCRWCRPELIGQVYSCCFSNIYIIQKPDIVWILLDKPNVFKISGLWWWWFCLYGFLWTGD